MDVAFPRQKRGTPRPYIKNSAALRSLREKNCVKKLRTEKTAHEKTTPRSITSSAQYGT